MPLLVAARHYTVAAVSLAVVFTAGCRPNLVRSDHPRLAPGVRMVDVTFHCTALNRDMPYRVFLPAFLAPNTKYSVAYLLHGGGGDFRDWSNGSDVAEYAAQGLILVMPEGGSSYYVNSATRPRDRYEDYVVEDLIPDAEARFPAAARHAVAGVSMGGYGTIRIAFDHPDLFAFVGTISAALDVPSRPFSILRVGQWLSFRTLFGPIGSPAERARPFPLRSDYRSRPRALPLARSRGTGSPAPAPIADLPTISESEVSSSSSTSRPAGTTGSKGTSKSRASLPASSGTSQPVHSPRLTPNPARVSRRMVPPA